VGAIYSDSMSSCALDGVFEDPSWTFEFGFDPAMGGANRGDHGGRARRSCSGAGHTRCSPRRVNPGPPTRTRVRRSFNESPKYVVSSSLETAGLEQLDDPRPVRTDHHPDLKDKGRRGYYVSVSKRHAGPGDARRRPGRRAAPVRLSVARGAGQNLFADSGPATKFRLAESEAYSNGVLHLGYAPAAAEAA